MHQKKTIFPIQFDARGIAILSFLISSQFIYAQTAHIAVVDLYGLRKVKEADVRQALRISVGDSIDLNSFTKKEIVGRMREIPGVKKADIGLVCCYGAEAGWILYGGISENENDSMPLFSAPRDTVKLPAEIISTAEKFDSLFFAAIQNGDSGEDDSQGYTLSDNAAVRACQQDYMRYARLWLPILKKTLRSSYIGDQRAIAATIIAYSSNKKEAVDDLLYAIHDPYADVRNNASRALAILADYAINNQGTGIHIPADDFIQMIRSVVWTDRNKGIFVLVSLTAGRDSSVMAQLKKNSLPELIEMAGWTNPGHAGAAFMILGRMAGYENSEIIAGVSSDKRLAMLKEFIMKID